MSIQVLLLTPEKLWFVSAGTFKAKNIPFGGFSYIYPKCHYVCRYNGFYSTKFKLTCVTTRNLIIHLFWKGYSIPMDLKSPELIKMPLLAL